MTGHMDKAPMVLVHTTGCTVEGESRTRHFKTYDSATGKYVSEKYSLRQPDVHSKYRGQFSRIDTFDKFAVGHGSLTRNLRT